MLIAGGCTRRVLRERVRLQPLRVEKRLVKTIDDAALRALLNYKPVGYSQWRVHTTICTILDTGCRIDEMLTARVRDFDFDNLLLTVIGKGDKQRIVPISFELRKRLVRFEVKARKGIAADFMFAARDGWLVAPAQCPSQLLPLARSDAPRQVRVPPAPAHVRNRIP